MKKKSIALIMVVLLAVSYLTVLAFADTGIEAENGVITAELQSVMDSVSATAKIPVSIWTTEIDTAVVEEIALAKSGYNKDSIRALVDQGKIDTVTLEDVDKYIAAERRIYAQMQTQAHQAFVNDYAFLKKASAAENAYICSYAPMMIVELTTSQIETLAKDSDVNTMYYSPKTQSEPLTNVSLPLTKADYVRDEAFSGTGIRIGMVETGVPDTARTSFQNSNIVTDPANPETIRSFFLTQADYEMTINHASVVAEIMVSSSSVNKGIVPDAELFCSAMTGKDGGFFEAVEDLLQLNVVVINMSAEVYNIYDRAYGEYTFLDAWADHIAHNHSVHFVVAAGNYDPNLNTNLRVTHPALAYNVITVGAIDDGNTIEMSNDVIASYSCYNEVSYVDPETSDTITAPNKPDVVAPGSLIKTSTFLDSILYSSESVEPIYISGTSFAAPHVTGIVAQLIQQYPALATLQDLMKAILTAGVSHDILQYDSDNPNFEMYGAGVVDSKACTNISYRGTFASSSFSSTQANTNKTYSFNATSADTEIRVSLAWLRSVWFASTTNHVTTWEPETCSALANLDLAIIAPNGTELPMDAMANYDDNTNLVVIQFDPETYGYGTYTVQVWIRESTGTRTYFGLAWWANRE